MLIKVAMKLTEAKIEDRPAKCKLKIVKSTLESGWACKAERGG